MQFISIERAKDIERSDVRLLGDAAVAVRAHREDADVVSIDVGSGLATWSSPGSPFNKIAGLGFDDAIPGAALDHVEEEWAKRKTPVQIDLSSLAQPQAIEQLIKRGYTLVGFENLLGRTLPINDSVLLPATAGVSVEPCPQEDTDTWISLLVDGFADADEHGVPSHEHFPRDVVDRAITDFSRVPGMKRFLARVNGEPAGGGAMRLDGQLCQLCGAATVLRHRRLGVQRVLLARRLKAAAEAGCTLATITTQPGSTSMKNAQRWGFELLYVRAILMKDGTN